MVSLLKLMVGKPSPHARKIWAACRSERSQTTDRVVRSSCMYSAWDDPALPTCRSLLAFQQTAAPIMVMSPPPMVMESIGSRSSLASYQQSGLMSLLASRGKRGGFWDNPPFTNSRKRPKTPKRPRVHPCPKTPFRPKTPAWKKFAAKPRKRPSKHKVGRQLPNT